MYEYLQQRHQELNGRLCLEARDLEAGNGGPYLQANAALLVVAAAAVGISTQPSQDKRDSNTRQHPVEATRAELPDMSLFGTGCVGE